MLILTRRIEEEIKIGKDITVKIISVSDNQVKIGISAPNNVQIFRSEVYDKVIQNTVEATKTASTVKVDLTKYKIHKVK